MPVALNPIVQNFLDKAGEQRQNPLRLINRSALPLGSRPDPATPGVQVNPVLKTIYGPAQAGPGSSNPNVGAPASSDALRHYAYSQLPKYGWDASQWGALDQLIQHESGWNPNAQNPTSTAYGIGQFLDSTWAGVGGQKTNDPYKQIDYVLKYIAQRGDYGSPAAAWQLWQQRAPHWY